MVDNTQEDGTRKEAEDKASGLSTHLGEEREGEEGKRSKSNADETELMLRDHEGEMGLWCVCYHSNWLHHTPSD